MKLRRWLHRGNAKKDCFSHDKLIRPSVDQRDKESFHISLADWNKTIYDWKTGERFVGRMRMLQGTEKRRKCSCERWSWAGCGRYRRYWMRMRRICYRYWHIHGALLEVGREEILAFYFFFLVLDWVK